MWQSSPEEEEDVLVPEFDGVENEEKKTQRHHSFGARIWMFPTFAAILLPKCNCSLLLSCCNEIVHIVSSYKGSCCRLTILIMDGCVGKDVLLCLCRYMYDRESLTGLPGTRRVKEKCPANVKTDKA
jgi:hypothetical protein